MQPRRARTYLGCCGSLLPGGQLLGKRKRGARVHNAGRVRVLTQPQRYVSPARPDRFSSPSPADTWRTPTTSHPTTRARLPRTTSMRLSVSCVARRQSRKRPQCRSPRRYVVGAMRVAHPPLAECVRSPCQVPPQKTVMKKGSDYVNSAGATDQTLPVSHAHACPCEEIGSRPTLEDSSRSQ